MTAASPLVRPPEGDIRVLHVDDDPDFAALAATALERADDRLAVEVETGASGGLQRFDDGGFDCIVSDYDMPGRDGIEFLEAVREADASFPFVLFTGKGSEEIASEAISAGVTDYLQKGGGTDQFTVLANRVINACEHHRSQRQVARSQRRLRDLVDVLPHLLYVVDEDGTYLLANDTLARFHGRDVEAIEGATVDDVLGPRAAAQFRDDLQEVLDAGDRKRVEEAEIPDASGEVHVFEPLLLPFDLDRVDARAVLGIAVDVTERKRREEELERIRERMQLALEHTESILFEIDLDTGAVVRHGAFEQIFDQAPDDVPTWEDHLESAVHPEDREAFREFYAAVTAGDLTDGDLEYRANPDGGDVRWIRDTVSVRREASLAVGIARDVTERKERERELTERTRQLRAVLDNVEAAIWIRDTDSRFLAMNQNFRDLFGIDEPEVVGERPEDLLADEVAAQFRANDERVLETEEPIELEETVETERGTRSYLTRISPLYADGELYATCGISSDITEQKARERDLSRQIQRLDEFASVVSHDLRNPLTVAEGRLELAREEHDSDHLDEVARAQERMNELIDDLLTLARAGEDVQDLEPVAIDGIATTCWRNTDTGDGTLTVETSREVLADRSRLQQLLENLMRNAVEHGGADVNVRVGDLPTGFFVEDDGPGIAADAREAVFGTGYSTSDEGTGFGLSIVRQVAEAHGWSVRADAGTAGGARFEFTGVVFED